MIFKALEAQALCGLKAYEHLPRDEAGPDNGSNTWCTLEHALESDGTWTCMMAHARPGALPGRSGVAALWNTEVPDSHGIDRLVLLYVLKHIETNCPYVVD
jgi:hypothetical protein